MSDWWEKYRRIPFKERGRDKNGSDCWGFVRFVLREERGILLPSYDEAYQSSYQSNLIGKKIEAEIQNGDWQEVEKGQPFDVVVMKSSAAGVPCHVGLVTRPGSMIHLRRANKGVVIQPIRCMEWKNKTMGFMRYVAN